MQPSFLTTLSFIFFGHFFYVIKKNPLPSLLYKCFEERKEKKVFTPVGPIRFGHQANHNAFRLINGIVIRLGHHTRADTWGICIGKPWK